MIKNKTKKTRLCKNKKILTSMIGKAIGLMFSKKIIDTGYIFVFEKATKVDLHMFFVFFKIDLAFLDASRRVLEIKDGFLPFTFYFSKNKAKYVIELPFGTLKKSRTCIGDTLDF